MERKLRLNYGVSERPHQSKAVRSDSCTYIAAWYQMWNLDGKRLQEPIFLWEQSPGLNSGSLFPRICSFLGSLISSVLQENSPYQFLVFWEGVQASGLTTSLLGVPQLWDWIGRLIWLPSPHSSWVPVYSHRALAHVLTVIPGGRQNRAYHLYFMEVGKEDSER